MDVEIFTKLGFSRGEIAVYLALLQLGETSTGDIIKKSEISSSKVYEILEKLLKKGLVSYVIKEKIKFFQPCSPQRIKEYMIKRRMEMEENERQMEKIIPSLEQMQKVSEYQQSVTVYEGYGGMKTAFNRILETLDKGDEYYVFTLDETAESDRLRRFLINFQAKRVEKGLRVKLLTCEKFRKIIMKNFPKYKYSQRRFVDRAFPTGVFIFKNHVMHFMYKPNPTLFVIQSKTTYKSYKKFFLELWADAKT